MFKKPDSGVAKDAFFRFCVISDQCHTDSDRLGDEDDNIWPK